MFSIVIAARHFALQHLTTRHGLIYGTEKWVHSKHACMLRESIFTHAVILNLPLGTYETEINVS